MGGNCASDVLGDVLDAVERMADAAAAGLPDCLVTSSQAANLLKIAFLI